MTDYEINENTLALIPLKKNKTKVFEDNKVYIVNKSIKKVMEDSCEYFGSSLLGRQKGTSSLIGISHKAPIIIEETKEIIFFPTKSPRLDDCIWISLKNLNSHYLKNNKSVLVFKNKVEISSNTTYGIINNQILRATRLESVLRKRKNIN